ncbi:DUF4328 domain-containing protein [Micromonospora echinaurantiaca]|uniref:DUF4328 domain-containing protein n=1 Tax=Micromonospora echinaurantiaca TaxID=47857 RepID=UPI003721640B
MRPIGLAAPVAVGVSALCYLLLSLALLAVPALSEDAPEQDASHAALVALVASGVLGVLYLLSFVAAGVLVIIWTYRARRNLDAFPGNRADLSAGWAIAAWLVPLANLVMPFVVLAELARDSLWRERTPPLVGVWWAGWLSFTIGDRVYSLMNEPPLFWSVLPALGCLVAGGSLVILVVRISSAQETRIARGRPAWSVLPGMTVTSPSVAPPAGGTIGA